MLSQKAKDMMESNKKRLERFMQRMAEERGRKISNIKWDTKNLEENRRKCTGEVKFDVDGKSKVIEFPHFGWEIRVPDIDQTIDEFEDDALKLVTDKLLDENVAIRMIRNCRNIEAAIAGRKIGFLK